MARAMNATSDPRLPFGDVGKILRYGGESAHQPPRQSPGEESERPTGRTDDDGGNDVPIRYPRGIDRLSDPLHIIDRLSDDV